MTADEEIVTFRLAPRDRAAIQRLVDEGEFRNRSDFLRYAVKQALADYEPSHAPKARVDLELEGIDLPSHTSGAQRRPRARKGVNL